MKRFYLLLCLLAVGGTASAQLIHSSMTITEKTKTRQDHPKIYHDFAKGYRGFVEAAPMLGDDDFDDFAIELSTTHGYQFNPWVYTGVGVGISMFSATADTKKLWSTPVFASLKVYMSRRLVKPFLDIRLGYLIPLSSDMVVDTYNINNTVYTRSTYFIY